MMLWLRLLWTMAWAAFPLAGYLGRQEHPVLCAFLLAAGIYTFPLLLLIWWPVDPFDPR